MEKVKVKATKPEYKIITDEEGAEKKVLDEERSKALEIEYEMPTTVPEFTKKFGDEGTVALATAHLKVKLQDVIRRGLEDGSTPEMIMESVNSWDPMQGPARKDPEKVFIQKFLSATPAEQAAMMKNLQAMASKK